MFYFFLFFWSGCPFLLCPALRVRPDSPWHFPRFVEPQASRTARYLFVLMFGAFFKENARDKMPRRAFYPAFQGYAYAPARLRRSCCATFPIGARFLCKKVANHENPLPSNFLGMLQLIYLISAIFRQDFSFENFILRLFFASFLFGINITEDLSVVD